MTLCYLYVQNIIFDGKRTLSFKRQGTNTTPYVSQGQKNYISHSIMRHKEIIPKGYWGKMPM